MSYRIIVDRTYSPYPAYLEELLNSPVNCLMEKNVQRQKQKQRSHFLPKIGPRYASVKLTFEDITQRYIFHVM